MSEPAGFLQKRKRSRGDEYPSLTPALSATGYAFGYWTVNGVRQAGADALAHADIERDQRDHHLRHSTLRNLRIPMAMGSRTGLSIGCGEISARRVGEILTGMDFPTFGK